MKKLQILIVILFTILVFQACNKSKPEIIDVKQPNATVMYPADCGETTFLIKFDSTVQNLPSPNNDYTYYELKLTCTSSSGRHKDQC